MEPSFAAIILAVAATASLLAGIWLVRHLTALAAIFEGRADIVASPKPPRATPAAVWAALAVFLLGTGGSMAIWSLAILS